MFVRFFIDRPIFASVLSIFITLAGALAVGTLPLSQYPPVTPPTIQIDCNYPGASAQVVSETIASPRSSSRSTASSDMLYMSSQCQLQRRVVLRCTVTFKHRQRPELGPSAGAEPRQPGDAPVAADVVPANGQ